jgi:peroxiredoxin
MWEIGMLGRRIPDVTFKTRIRDENVGGPNPFRWQAIRSSELFSGKRVVVFSLPGAFTPTCSSKQCPAFELHYDRFRSLGVQDVFCISVNDAFVMYQWGRQLGLSKVKLIPDGSGHFTRRMGMLINKEHLGFGYRSWRYSMLVSDCIVEKWYEEPGINDAGTDDDPYEVTDPETMLNYLEQSQAGSAVRGADPSARRRSN